MPIDVGGRGPHRLAQFGRVGPDGSQGLHPVLDATLFELPLLEVQREQLAAQFPDTGQALGTEQTAEYALGFPVDR